MSALCGLDAPALCRLLSTFRRSAASELALYWVSIDMSQLCGFTVTILCAFAIRSALAACPALRDATSAVLVVPRCAVVV